MRSYLSRLLFATLVTAVWGIGGGFGMWFMWQYVANAYETWDYFPRGMFTIPAAITLAWGGGIALFLWFWVNCLFNTKYAQKLWAEELEEAPARRLREEAEAAHVQPYFYEKARVTIAEQADRMSKGLSEEEADAFHAWLNAAGVSDERIISGWVDDLATEAEAVYDLAGKLRDTEGLGHERAIRLAAMQHGRPPTAKLLALIREDPEPEDTSH